MRDSFTFGKLVRQSWLGVFITFAAVASLAPMRVQAIGEEGYLIVTSWNDHSIYRYDALTGEFVDKMVPRRGGGLFHPWACILSPYDGSLLVSSGHFAPGLFQGALNYDGVTGEFIGPFTPSGYESHGITYGPDGNVYIGERLAPDPVGLISRFDGITGEYLGEFVAPGSGGLRHPVSHVFGPSNGNPNKLDLYVVNVGLAEVLRYDGDTGEFLEVFVESGSGGLERPEGMTFGPDGNVYVINWSPTLPAILRFQGPHGKSPGAFMDVFVPTGSGGLENGLFGLLFGPDANGDGHHDLYVPNQGINLTSYNAINGTGSVKIYDGVTGAYIRDLVSVENSAGLAGPSLFTFTYTDPVTLEYLGD